MEFNMVKIIRLLCFLNILLFLFMFFYLETANAELSIESINKVEKYLKEGQSEEAFVYSRNLIKNDPITGYFVLGLCYLNQKEYSKSIEFSTKSLELEPNPNTYLLRASAYSDFYEEAFESKNYELLKYVFENNILDKAKLDINKAIELNPNLSEAYYFRSFLYNSKNEDEKKMQEKDLNKACELGLEKACEQLLLNKSKEWNKKGVSLAREAKYSENNEEKYKKAISCFNKCIEIYKNNSLCYSNRSYVYLLKGDYNKAMKDIEKAIELDPNSSNYYFLRGNIYSEIGNNAKAVTDYKKACELGDNDACNKLEEIGK